MLAKFVRLILSTVLFSTISSTLLFSQGQGGSTLLLNNGLMIAVAIVLLIAVYLLTENLMGIRGGGSAGPEKPKSSGGMPSYVRGHAKRLKRGHNIRLKGAPTSNVTEVGVRTFALQPPNFIGISPIPKVTVIEGDEVMAGDVLFYDKKRPAIKYVSPVSGEIVSVNRGAKRSIAEVVILADKEQRYKVSKEIDLDKASREEIVNFLLDSGGWPLIRQRPYDIVPDPGRVPDNIFVTTFDTAPLAPDSALVVRDREKEFSTGIKLLSMLTSGKVHLGLSANGKSSPPPVFTETNHSDKHWFAGPHPTGNVGVQIHHIDPIGKGMVWVLGVQEVITLGSLITEQRFDGRRVIAIGGEGVENPRHVYTHLGAKLSDLLGTTESVAKMRIISGDVLSGRKKAVDGFLNFYDDQVTVIPEGKSYQFFGWLFPTKMLPSVSRTFPGFLMKNYEYNVDTNTHGEERAFVMTGQYEKLLPMDIYPNHLMKAILAKDFEKMEGLGIYELSEEDLALCEFACTSKQPLQHILRAGLDLMREQG